MSLNDRSITITKSNKLNMFAYLVIKWLILGYSSCVGLLPTTVAQYCCMFYSREAGIIVTIPCI